MTTKSSAPNNLFQQGLGLTNAVQSATDKIPEYQQYQNMLANGMGNTPEGRTQMLAMQDILRQKQSALPEYQAFQNFSQTTNYPSTPTPSNQPTLPPQIGQQMFGGAGGGSGLGSLGGGGGGGGQTNVSLNLQGSATMNPQGANQNRGYPGMNFASAQQQDQSRGTMMFAEGGPAQQVTQFQPTFSPAQQGIGSLQPYQAPNVPAMESSPTDYNQSPQYAPTQQYGASATSYSAPAANPMTAGLGSYLQGLEYKAPPVASPVATPVTSPVASPVAPPISEPPSWASNPGTSYNPLVNYDNYGSPLGRKDEPNRPDARPTYNDEGQISNTFDYFQDDEGTVKSIYDEDGIRKYNDDGSRVNEDAPAERREDVLARIQKEEPVVNSPASPITYDPVTQTYGETTPTTPTTPTPTTPTLSSPDTQTYSGTTPTPTLYNPATQSYSDNQAFTAPVAPIAKDSGSDSGYFYDDEGGRRSVYDEDGNRRYNDDGSSLYDSGDKAGGPIRAYAHGGSTPQGIASLGRGKDTMLVHMTPGEVHGLQQLAMRHGGSLTINPQTGLPEAGILSALLPLALGFALGPAGLGMSSLAAAATVGGIGALATGSLAKGLQYGFGSYGGAGLGEGLSSMGAEQAGALATPELNASAELAGKNAYQQRLAAETANQTDAIAQAAGDSTQTYYPPKVTNSAFDEAGNAWGDRTPTTYEEPGFVGPITSLPAPTFSQTPEQFAELSRQRAIENVGDTFMPEAGSAASQALARSPTGNAFEGFKQLGTKEGLKTLGGKLGLSGVASLAAPLLSSAMTPAATALPANKPTQYYNTSYNPPKYNPATGAYDPASYDSPGSYYTDPTQYAAQGGTVGYARGGTPDFYPLTGDRVTTGGLGGSGEDPKNSRNIYSDEGGINNNKVGRGVSSDTGGIHTNTPSGLESLFAETSPTILARYKTAKNPVMQAAAKRELDRRANRYNKDYGVEETISAAQGGLMGLNTYAAGGKLLRGPGDGMSDSIPAVIQGANPQRAALADGEFVIPADVVSHLGNGSTGAGSKRLYAMMDRVRKARTGNPKQGRQINPDRFMPA